MEENNQYIASLNDAQIDALREIGNIGSGNAASSLADMLNRKVDMNVPSVKILDISELAEMLGGPETEVVGILFSLKHDFEGMMMFLTEKKFAHLVLNVLMNKNFESFDELNEMDLSAIAEVGNVMVGAYINAISMITNLKIGITAPALAIDMVGALLNVPAVEIEKYGDKALFIQDGFIDGTEQVTSYLMLIPEIEYLKKIFEILGMEI